MVKSVVIRKFLDAVNVQTLSWKETSDGPSVLVIQQLDDKQEIALRKTRGT